MDGFRDVLYGELIKLGVSPDDMFTGSQLNKLASNLPGFYRATKNWDLVVCKNAKIRNFDQAPSKPQLLAAIEFKSQKDSIGNNQNNRIEESIGNAVDFWDSYEQGTFGSLLPRPWLGYLFIGRYEEGQKNKSVKITHPLISVDPVFSTTKENWEESIKFNGCSYADRYRIFLDRMIGKKLYDGASFLITNETIANKTPNYQVLYPHLSGATFVKGLLNHLKAYYFDQETS